MTPRELLIAAKAKIATPETWTTGASARLNKPGSAVGPKDPRASCWCALGACFAVSDSMDDFDAAFNHLQKTAIVTFGCGVVALNDRAGFTAVHKLLDKAIANAK